ncbi:MAG: D-alanyl-D-alanine carboxypeptidase family protein [Bacillota bacterium]|nr:D-alanyl-D-alanine carboxypeptidase family protein [Bacillota bacterium]
MRYGRRYILLFMVLFFVLNMPLVSASGNPPDENRAQPETNGKAVVLLDANSGRVLYENNSHEKLPPASVTKIMTALLVIEKGDLDKNAVISEHAADTPEATIYAEPGEVLSRMDLLYAAMLPSANDACTALAESVSGNEASFIELMNQRARELGMKDTHYCNPHGLQTTAHVTSACDLALLAREALSNEAFAKIVGTKQTQIPWVGRDENRVLINQNRLLYRYDGAIGVKTGYTQEAGNCVVGAAKKGDMTLISVSLNSPTVYDDLQNMLDYGFENYQMVTVAKSNQLIKEVKVIG